MVDLKEKQKNFKFKRKRIKRGKMPQEHKDKIGRANKLKANKIKQEQIIKEQKEEVKDLMSVDIREQLADYLGLPR